MTCSWNLILPNKHKITIRNEVIEMLPNWGFQVRKWFIASAFIRVLKISLKFWAFCGTHIKLSWIPQIGTRGVKDWTVPFDTKVSYLLYQLIEEVTFHTKISFTNYFLKHSEKYFLRFSLCCIIFLVRLVHKEYKILEIAWSNELTWSEVRSQLYECLA